MVCSFLWNSESCQFTLKKILFLACVVTWELLGNICSEELGCKQSVQSAGVQSFRWLERLKLCGCCGRLRHICELVLGWKFQVLLNIHLKTRSSTRSLSADLLPNKLFGFQEV